MYINNRVVKFLIKKTRLRDTLSRHLMTMKPIDNPDKDSDSLEYWNLVLKSHGLSMSAGSMPSRKVSFVGGINNLVGVEEEEFKIETGVIKPERPGPDK
jgi:hypothetical protein